MYSIKNKYWQGFFKCLLFASSLVLFGNRLTNRFHLAASTHGGLYRILHSKNHPYPDHRDLDGHYAKMLSSVDKRYHMPMWVGIGGPVFRILPILSFVEFSSFLSPPPPSVCAQPGVFLRGPPLFRDEILS
jgi:hypothetical protein